MTKVPVEVESDEKEKGKQPLEKQHSAHGKYDGVIPHRRSTDVLFFLIIVGFWVAMTIVGYNAIKDGNPYRIISPINDVGKICGQSESVKDLPYFYPVLTVGVGVCTASCPQNVTVPKYNSSNPEDYYCLDYITSTNADVLQLYIYQYCLKDGVFDINSNCGCMLKYNTKSVLHRCQFTNQTIARNFVKQKFVDYLTGFIADIYNVRNIIFGYGIGVSMAVAFVFVSLLRSVWLTTLLVWTMMFGVLALFAVLCNQAYVIATQWERDDPQAHSDDEVLGLKAVSIVFMVLTGLWAIVMVFYRSYIQLGIKILSLTSECIESMPTILLTPILQALGMVFFLVPWVIFLFFIASDGTFTAVTQTVPNTGDLLTFQYQTYSLDSSDQQRLWFLFFVYLWTAEFISAVGTIIISIATAKWYFSKPEDRGIRGGMTSLCFAWYDALRYHLGTAAFGSLLIAIVQFIRYVLLYLEKTSKKYQDNKLAQCVFCCINCCLKCLECGLKFICRNAYIQTAIHGSSFCFGAKEAFFLVFRNLLRIGILDSMADMAMFASKVLIVSITGGTAFFVLSNRYQDKLNGLMAPVILTMFVAYAVASIVTTVFTSVADTMIQCFITDEEFHHGKAVFCSPQIKDFVDKHTVTQDEYESFKGETSSKKRQREEEQKRDSTNNKDNKVKPTDGSHV